MRGPAGIYVEILIPGAMPDVMDEVWRRTQDPALHERWDLRFTSIRYLPRDDPSSPQRFLYSTRIGFGVGIEGEGESVGSRDGPGGARTSALKFWSADPLSLILEGSGYWKYIPTPDGVKFLTWYDYTTRFGAVGRALDLVFRPLIGWATAWSFDRLRLWIVRGIDPAAALERSAVYALARGTVAGVFLWHGLVPKLIFHHPDEVAMVADAGFGAAAASLAVTAAGIAEVVLGVLLLVRWRSRMLLMLVMVLMIVAAIGVGVFSPQYLTAAFNPVTLNACVAALAAIALIAGRELPSASTCRRRADQA